MARSVHVCAVFLAMFGACHDDAAPPPPPPAISSAARAAKSPPVVVDLSLGAGLEMRRPLREGRLAVIPIVALGDWPKVSYTTLADAVANHRATVREVPGQWQVDTVRIHNKGPDAIVAYEGELILDAKQDRVLAETRVIAPGINTDVPVRCVEQSREAGGHAFMVPGLLAELELRRVVAFRAQIDVWQKIDAINAELALTPPTKTYRAAAQRIATGELGARRARIAAELASHPDRDRMVGLAAVIDGEVIAIDRFATPELFRAEENELLGAYVANSGGAPHEGRTFLPSDVRALATTPGQIWTTDATFTALHPL